MSKQTLLPVRTTMYIQNSYEIDKLLPVLFNVSLVRVLYADGYTSMAIGLTKNDTMFFSTYCEGDIFFQEYLMQEDELIKEKIGEFIRFKNEEMELSLEDKTDSWLVDLGTEYLKGQYGGAVL